MKIVIEIPKEVHDHVLKAKSTPDILGIDIVNVINAVKNGIPLPKGHGNLIDANNLKRAFVLWSPAVQERLFTDADIASIIDHSQPIIKAEKE